MKSKMEKTEDRGRKCTGPYTPVIANIQFTCLSHCSCLLSNYFLFWLIFLLCRLFFVSLFLAMSLCSVLVYFFLSSPYRVCCCWAFYIKQQPFTMEPIMAGVPDKCNSGGG